MDVLDRLERLARLRETGALSEAEFERAKALLLADTPAALAPASAPAPPAGFAPEAAGRPVWPWLAGAAVLIAVVVAIGLLVGRDVGGAAAGNFTAAPEVAVGNGSVEEPVPAASPSAPVADYAFASSAGVLAITPEDLEQRLGPAESKAGGRWAFHVGGCAVTYTVRRDAIVAATLPVDAACHPMVDDTVISERTTLGSLHGRYRADCVAQCRGPADPVLTLTTRGAVYTALDAPLDAWAAALRPDDDAVGDLVDGSGSGDTGGDDPARFTCVVDPPAAVAAQFAALTVSSVTIGHDPASACRRRASTQP